MTKRLALLAAIAIAIASGAAPGAAASPSSGQISSTVTALAWQGAHFTSAAYPSFDDHGQLCFDPLTSKPYPTPITSGAAACDVFTLDVAIDPSFWSTNSSDDGGATWRDTRVGKRMSDPQLNAPTDGAGHAFFGDYQGLVADDRWAIPFYNSTEFAFVSTKDSEYSPYQEAVAGRVLNR